MSVKRYQPVAQCVEPSYQAQMVEPKVMEFSEGEYVLHSDYASLKAEVAYLKGEEHPYANLGSMMPKYLLEHWIKENARLKAEVERLRKAGDAMVPLLGRGDYHDARINWNAAKEGKQS